jgi:hypothetical protein
MTLRAVYPNPLQLEGSHSTPGRDGTTLSYVVHLLRDNEDEVTAYLDVSTYGRDATGSREARVCATADSERAALERLSSYLRRVADSLDAGLAGVRLPLATPQPDGGPK